MAKGLVFGKFMPLHKGHLVLIDFACRHCDYLYIVLCYTEKELIPGEARKQWLTEEIKKYPQANLISFQYDDKELPNTSESSREVSAIWANAFKKITSDVNVVFTSETYGDYIAEYMKIKHVMFDIKRTIIPVSASQIRARPFDYWDLIADAAKSYFVKKIVLVGSESTGKTTLAEKLARHYNTVFVPEMAREIIEKTNECTYKDLFKIAELHAATILKKLPEADKLFFADTDILITKSYSQFLFGKELIIDNWIETANKFDLYLFLEPDCDYIQDGTRLSVDERNTLSEHHKATFKTAGVAIEYINGNCNERFEKAITIIDKHFFSK